MKGEGCKASREETLGRLRWRCRRGLLELDLWLQRFLDAVPGSLSEEECAAFEALLEEADSDLLAWLEGRQDVPAEHVHMLGLIRASV